MNKTELIQRLAELPAEIAQKETTVIETAQRVDKFKEALATREAELLTSGVIDGRNKETRDAQLQQHTIQERQQISVGQEAYDRARLELNQAINEFKSLRAIARLLDSEVA